MGTGRYWGRRIVPVVIVLLLTPVALAGLQYDGNATPAPEPGVEPSVSPANLTVVTTQGADPRGDNVGDGRLAGIRTDNRSVVFVHDRHQWYYDVDPIDNRTLLFTALDTDGPAGSSHYAIEWNWVTNETERRFRVPGDTHDVDRLGPHRYAVADKADHRAFVYNYTADEGSKHAIDEIEWAYRFREHYPGPPEAGESGDYTHLNDVDTVHDGSAFLLSPRNFNRVLAVNRTTKGTEWTLGDQERPWVLHGQHDPVVLETDPLTVLVGDSLNHRAVEYRRTNGRWRQVWAFNAGLNWPRDVDRLPNGNTLITDTANDRVIEVAPNGSLVWQYNTTDPHPYDAERVHLGDEPRGPTIAEIEGNTVTNVTTSDNSTAATGDDPFRWAYRTAGWVLPIWVSPGEFVPLVLALVVAVGWLGVEGTMWLRGVVSRR